LDIQQKSIGIQLGFKATVTPIQKTYYIKTHSNGRLSQASSGAKLFDPKELFVYKFLEFSDLGPESFFFHRDSHNLYIATLDASHTRTQKGKFETFNQYQQTHLKQLSGRLNSSNNTEELITNNPEAKRFAKSIVMLDLLSRLFSFTDLSTNPENYGFTLVDDQLPALQDIDFRIQHDDSLELNESNFDKFKTGDDSSHSSPFMQYILKGREQTKRLELGAEVMNDLYTKQQQLASAFKFVADYVQQFEKERYNLLAQLAKYTNTIIKNFETFNNLFKAQQ